MGSGSDSSASRPDAVAMGVLLLLLLLLLLIWEEERKGGFILIIAMEAMLDSSWSYQYFQSLKRTRLLGETYVSK